MTSAIFASKSTARLDVRLEFPFLRLTVKFDAARLREEIEHIPAAAWAPHPNGIPGNSSVRLISVDGAANDEVHGAMAPTPYLQQSPYLRQVLASFGVVWGRSRLMRLAPGATVPSHADINHHWFSRVRIHIPIITRPEVTFYCGDEAVHMAAGDAWLFDNWRAHRVENPTPDERIHLVADTSGSASFWQFVLRSQLPNTEDSTLKFDPQRAPLLVTEQMPPLPVMPPAELETLVRDLRAELMAQEETPQVATRLAHYHGLLDSFCRDWRQVYSVHGERRAGRAELRNLRDALRVSSKPLAEDLIMRTNRINAQLVLEARVLRAVLASDSALERPIFIIAAPRSGSTLLYETLATSSLLCNLGGEAHWLVESIPSLQVGAPGVTSNRLTEKEVTRVVEAQILDTLSQRLLDCDGAPLTASTRLRLLEKTPKNALRIPFFASLFPDAQFIFLWREPRGNISSIIDAWRSGNWKTYNGLKGFEGPWSLILPPGWQNMNARPLEEIAAFQWDTTNKIVLEDLAALPARQWTAVNYDAFVSNPAATVERLCRFIGTDVDDRLKQRTASALPLSRFTDTPPAAGKWHKNGGLLERVLPNVSVTWAALRALQSSPKR